MFSVQSCMILETTNKPNEFRFDYSATNYAIFFLFSKHY